MAEAVVESAKEIIQPVTKMVHDKEVVIEKPNVASNAQVDPVEAAQSGMQEATRRAIARTQARIK